MFQCLFVLLLSLLVALLPELLLQLLPRLLHALRGSLWLAVRGRLGLGGCVFLRGRCPRKAWLWRVIISIQLSILL